MAGIGFELRKLLQRDSYAGLLKAYAYAGVISSGPWVLSIIGILLVGMIAAIVLTHRGPKATKYTNPNQQVFVKAKDRVRVLQMPVEKD